MSDDQAMDQGALLQARDTIARQAAEIERLRRQVADERIVEDLRGALATAATVGAISSPVSHARLLEMIVETAAQVISARAGSLFLINEETQELTFEVALGQKGQEVKKFTVPMGHGIAGLVAMSGQPLAISDAERDPRQAADIARSVGYTPNSILCVPLFYNDQVTGVLELLDKEGAPAFGAGDMEVLGLFANLAAVAIEQSRMHGNVASLVAEALSSLGGAPAEGKESLLEGMSAFAGRMEHDAGYTQALDLARLVRQIAGRGDEESKAVRSILQSFAGYLEARDAAGAELEGMR